MTKTVLSVALVLLAAAGLMWWGRQNASAPQVRGTSALTADASAYNFGTISMKNGNVSHVFKVTNPTSADIRIPRVVTSCMCTAAYIIEPDGSKKGPFGMEGMGAVMPANDIIKAGETREIEAVYDPNAHGPAGVGHIERAVIVTDENGGQLTLGITADVTP